MNSCPLVGTIRDTERQPGFPRSIPCSTSAEPVQQLTCEEDRAAEQFGGLS